MGRRRTKAAIDTKDDTDWIFKIDVECKTFQICDRIKNKHFLYQNSHQSVMQNFALILC